MKNKILILSILFFINASCQDKKNDIDDNSNSEFSINLVGTVQFGPDTTGCGVGSGSDIWGYKDSGGNLYGLMGTFHGVSIVEIPSLNIVDSVQGPQDRDCYYHRDIKTYGHYAYVVSENYGQNAGIMILDLQYLPDSVSYLGSYSSLTDTVSHNISIDEATGFAYVQNRAGKIRILDLSDPTAPEDVGTINAYAVHDMFARNDTVWVAEGYNHSYAIYDLSDKSNPTLIVRIASSHTNAYAHNIWPDESGKIFLTTEETAGVPIKIFETTDFTSVLKRGQYLADGNLAHDVKVFKDRAYISHYESGVIILDITDPDVPELIGSYDTFPEGESSGYRGCWGVYPFVDDGYIIASNIDNKMIVLSFTD